ncbi:GntR family transcriptional regulator [Microbacterium gorillae]|uniref:GntR family transcriptional regulator n=1 Tax=Microbacterium gorillae TaxID=1231063 RepID=UPI000693D783|nr:GntR family transcriptional regulator [Microbacterium gorillae]
MPETSSRRVPTARRSDSRRLAEHIFLTVRTRILAGEYPPGSALSVEDLGAEFDTSRQPVMDAMRRLAGAWLVDIIPQVGCRVAKYSLQESVDLIHVTAQFEGEVAALAARRGTDEQMEQLRLCNERMQQTSDSADLIPQAREMHELILAAAHSEGVARASAQLWEFGHFGWTSAVQDISPVYIADPAYSRANMGALIAAVTSRQTRLARVCAIQWLTGALLAAQIDLPPDLA